MIRKSMVLPLAALVASPVAAQDAWRDYVADLAYRSQTSGCWVLVGSGDVWNSQQGVSGSREEAFLRLLISGEFMMDTIPADTAQTLWKERGWKEGEAHWLLVSPKGELVKEGIHRPSAESILETLRSAGLVPKWERRAAFLKAHPEHGEARWDTLQDAVQLAGSRIAMLQREGTLPPATRSPSLFSRPPLSFATSSDPSGTVLAERVLGEVAAALEPMLDVPEWQTHPSLMGFGLQVREWETSQYPRLQAMLLRFYEGLMGRLETAPTRDSLWVPLGLLGLALGRDPLEAATHVLPQPGTAWPSTFYLRVVVDGLSSTQNWTAVLTFLDGLAQPEQESGPTPERWRAFCKARGEVQLRRFSALIKLERWEEAQGALEGVRRWSGSSWKGFGYAYRRPLEGLTPEQKRRFEVLASAPELKDPEPLPPAPTPRLLLVGTPSWAAPWDQLKHAETLQAWEPSELRWEQASREQSQALCLRFGWDATPRWALFLGNELEAQATTCPPAQALSDRLQAVAPSRLHRLNQAIQKVPRNLLLRRDRAEVLLARKPRGAAEAQAAEDARLSHALLRFPEGWQPSPEIWEWAAQKVLPELELELRSWPSRPEVWRAWIQWAEQHPSRPSALTLVKSLALWGNETRWSALLPKEVHFAVAEELRRTGRFEDMRAWFQEAWAGIDLRPQGYRIGFRFGPEARATRLKEIEEAIVSPLREALTALRRDRDLVALDAAFTALMGEGRSATRRRGTP